MTAAATPGDLDAALLASPGSRVWIPVLGESMRPTLRDGDRVEVEIGPFRPRAGDVLLFRQADYLAVHRCLGRARGAGAAGPWRARGDGRPRLDPPVEGERLLGRVAAIDRAGRVYDLAGPGARIWGGLVAAHALFWSALGSLADRFGPRARGVVDAADRGSLALFHRVFFSAFHRRRLEEPVGGAC